MNVLLTVLNSVGVPCAPRAMRSSCRSPSEGSLNPSPPALQGQCILSRWQWAQSPWSAQQVSACSVVCELQMQEIFPVRQWLPFY